MPRFPWHIWKPLEPRVDLREFDEPLPNSANKSPQTSALGFPCLSYNMDQWMFLEDDPDLVADLLLFCPGSAPLTGPPSLPPPPPSRFGCASADQCSAVPLSDVFTFNEHGRPPNLPLVTVSSTLVFSVVCLVAFFAFRWVIQLLMSSHRDSSGAGKGLTGTAKDANGPLCAKVFDGRNANCCFRHHKLRMDSFLAFKPSSDLNHVVLGLSGGRHQGPASLINREEVFDVRIYYGSKSIAKYDEYQIRGAMECADERSRRIRAPWILSASWSFLNSPKLFPERYRNARYVRRLWSNSATGRESSHSDPFISDSG